MAPEENVDRFIERLKAIYDDCMRNRPTDGTRAKGATYYVSLASEATEEIIDIGEPAVAPLIAALPAAGDIEPWLILTLSRIGDRRAFEPLSAHLADGPFVCFAARAHALGKLGDTRAVAPLIDVLDHADEYARQEHEENQARWRRHGFYGFLDKTIGRLLCRSMERFILTTSASNYRSRAASALGILGDSRAIPVLQRYTDNSEETVRKVVGKALVRLQTTQSESA